ncbi:MAG TPA: N-methyl-L-tryptophan oxidase [Caldimonas sp.]|jgi:sarcosine oxidase|nr:N-methyl-L-tryptophan oxidase [Caldimonas sp.]HEX2541202.1 N-methyl-L-tryptophan oxidase [Caldimonas sp.]
MTSRTGDVADAVVVGLGAVGSATCHHLARGGARVVGIDRFTPPHDFGSSHGLSRVTRLAIGEGEAYVPLALRSHELWRDLEAECGEQLYRPTGGLIVSSDTADGRPYHGSDGFFARTVRVAQAFGIAHELLSAAQIRSRFPAFAVRDDERGYLEPSAGVLFPERAVAAQLRAAERCGATLRLQERVLRFEPRAGGVDVVTERGRVSADRVVVTAGPWTAGLGVGLSDGTLRVQRQALFWFRTTTPALYRPDACPLFIWMHGARPDDALYGFPMVDGIAGVKIAAEQYEVETDPDQVDRAVTAAEAAAMFERHIAGRLNGIVRDVVRTATCLYTSTPDAAFRIRAHPASPAITVVSACSGHGFKHSPALGEALAAKVLGTPPRVSLASWCGTPP